MPNMIKLEAQPDEIYDIELEHSLLEANEKLARQNRALLDQHGTTASKNCSFDQSQARINGFYSFHRGLDFS